MTHEFGSQPDVEKKRARSIIVTRLFFVLLGLAVVAGFAVLVFNALASIATRDALLDCTQPGGKCYAESEKRTGEAVQGLIDANKLDEVATRQIVLAAIVCDERVENDTLQKIEDCVKEEMEEANNE